MQTVTPKVQIHYGNTPGVITGISILGYLACCFTDTGTLWLQHYTAKQGLLLTQSIMCIVMLMTGAIDLVTDNKMFLVLFVSLRVFQGFVLLMNSACLIAYLKEFYKACFNSVNGCLQCGYFVGQGAGSVCSVYLYSKWGFVAPFVFCAGTHFVMVIAIISLLSNNGVNPVSKKENSELLKEDKANYGVQPVSKKENNEILKEEKAYHDDDEDKTPSSLSYLIMLPVLSMSLVNLNWGFIQIATTPYVTEILGVSLSVAGT